MWVETCEIPHDGYAPQPLVIVKTLGCALWYNTLMIAVFVF